MQLDGAEIRNFSEVTYGIKKDGSNKKPNIIKIPHYQRPYSWTQVYVEQLIKDWHKSHTSHLLQQNNDNKHEYFAGSIVTVKDQDISTLSLIDGQQRFTTIYLANFIRFLLARIVFKKTVETLKPTRFAKLIEVLVDSASYLYFDPAHNQASWIKTIERKLNEIVQKFDDLPIQSSDNEAIRKQYLNEILKTIGLPSTDHPEKISQDYFETHKKQLVKFNKNKSLLLQYDRKTFNQSLLRTLQNTVITIDVGNELELHFNKDFINTCSKTDKKYVDSIKFIFDMFKQEVSESSKNKNKDNFIHADSIITSLNKFLEEVKFCVIQTGNANDAYTLFEVLNDRSLSLSDLDLVKNIFYKYFVEFNTNKLEPDKIDDTIQELDELWIDEIFNENTPGYKKDLIAYFAISFITGINNITTKNKKGFRTAVESYFDNKLQNNADYGVDCFKKDFNIFYCCKKIVDLVDLQHQHKNKVALINEVNINGSTLSKTFHFIYALGQDGVLSGLTNYILKLLEEYINTPVKFEKEFKGLLNKTKNDDITYKRVQTQARNLWRASMMSKDYSEPKNISEKLVITNNLKSSNHAIDNLISDEKAAELCEEFRSWLASWNYNSSSQSMLKIKILFSRLIRSKFDHAGNLIEPPNFSEGSASNEAIEQLELDHIEPAKINPSYPKNFFNSSDRDTYVNGLGNMMPITRSNNSSKQNQPAIQGFSFYEQDLGSSSYLYRSTKDLFNRFNSNNIPTENFFTKRKDFLIDKFLKLIQA